jgi:hypothetical protein
MKLHCGSVHGWTPGEAAIFSWRRPARQSFMMILVELGKAGTLHPKPDEFNPKIAR